MVCPLYRGCPLLRGSNRIILIGRDKFGDLVLSIVERYLIQCPFLGGSSLRGSTVFIIIVDNNSNMGYTIISTCCTKNEDQL